MQVIDFPCVRHCTPFGHFVESRILPRFRDVKPRLFHKVIHKLCGYPEKPFRFAHLAQLVRGRFEVAARQVRAFCHKLVDLECKMHLRKRTGQMYS
ncbi:hypothetical protein [Massilia sp.]|uniref:hypothetical protein n=1 Tax=Massilia sp. TaxID=1882437 RepID=UPI00289B209A|nr:hypothetical protein [Massilia sp.]